MTLWERIAAAVELSAPFQRIAGADSEHARGLDILLKPMST
jgi:hypothetical protein